MVRAAAFWLAFRQVGLGEQLAARCGMAQRKHIVYVLKTESEPTRYYTGLTSDLGRRLDAHNAGRVSHTARCMPWVVDVIVEFSDERRAVAFEKYLKSGSGCAFAQRHLR